MSIIFYRYILIGIIPLQIIHISLVLLIYSLNNVVINKTYIIYFNYQHIIVNIKLVNKITLKYTFAIVADGTDVGVPGTKRGGAYSSRRVPGCVAMTTGVTAGRVAGVGETSL